MINTYAWKVLDFLKPHSVKYVKEFGSLSLSLFLILTAPYIQYTSRKTDCTKTPSLL